MKHDPVDFILDCSAYRKLKELPFGYDRSAQCDGYDFEKMCGDFSEQCMKAEHALLLMRDECCKLDKKMQDSWLSASWIFKLGEARKVGQEFKKSGFESSLVKEFVKEARRLFFASPILDEYECWNIIVDESLPYTQESVLSFMHGAKMFNLKLPAYMTAEDAASACSDSLLGARIQDKMFEDADRSGYDESYRASSYRLVNNPLEHMSNAFIKTVCMNSIVVDKHVDVWSTSQVSLGFQLETVRRKLVNFVLSLQA